MLVYTKVNEEGIKQYHCIDYDTDCESPREWGSQLGHFITYNKNYSPDSYDGEFRDVVEQIFGSYHIDETKHVSNGYVVFPVYIYEHSGIAYGIEKVYPFNGRWDAGLAGLIYASKDEVREFFQCKNITVKIVEKVKQEFNLEADEYTSWANGMVFKNTIYEYTDSMLNWVDSCGYYYDVDTIKSDYGLDDSCEYKEYPNLDALKLQLRRDESMAKLGRIGDAAWTLR